MVSIGKCKSGPATLYSQINIQHRLLKMIITISLSETLLTLFVLCPFSSLLIDLRWPRVYEGHYQVNIKQFCSPFWKRIVGYRWIRKFGKSMKKKSKLCSQLLRLHVILYVLIGVYENSVTCKCHRPCKNDSKIIAIYELSPQQPMTSLSNDILLRF